MTTKEENIENVKIAKNNLKNILNENGCAMNGWGKAEAYNVIRGLVAELNEHKAIHATGLFKDSNTVDRAAAPVVASTKKEAESKLEEDGFIAVDMGSGEIINDEFKHQAPAPIPAPPVVKGMDSLLNLIKEVS